jgi:hypothetical protein
LLCTAALVTGAICQTTATVAIVNPTQQPLFVQIDERPPFEVPPGGEVLARLPALDRLAPMSITARDARGQTVFFRALSLPRIEQLGNRVELVASGQPADPFAELR